MNDSRESDDAASSASVGQASLMEALRTAQRIVDECRLAEELRPIAFARALDQLLSQTAGHIGAQSVGDSPVVPPVEPPDPAWEVIIRRSKVPLSVWEQVVHEHDQEI